MKLLKFILSFLLLLVLTPTVSHSKNLVKKWPLISTKQYSALSKVQQKKYIQELRLAVLNFEKTLKSKGEKYSFYESILETLFPQAYANTIDSNQCIIGGLIRKKVNGLCPTYGRGKGCKTSDGSMMTDGFRCGIIYGSACVPRKEINSLSERCHQAGQSSYPTANEYAKYKEMLWRLQSELCTNEQKATPCEFMRIRLEELEKKYTSEIQSNENKFSCHRTYDQGNNGTCHAFCTLCATDYIEHKNNNTGNSFRSSANWNVLISAMVKICDGGAPSTWRNAGYVDRNQKALINTGYCDTNIYRKYEQEKRNGQLLGSQFLSSGNWYENYHKHAKIIKEFAQKIFDPDSTKNGDYSNFTGGTDRDREVLEQLVRKARELKDSGYVNLPSEDEIRNSFSNYEKSKNDFRDQFGISVGSASQLFCYDNRINTTTDLSYELENVQDAEHDFLACAKQAFKKADNYMAKKCETKTKVYDDFTNYKNSIIQELKSGKPVSIILKVPSGYHCVTLEEYDSENNQFLTVNSYGSENKNWKIPATTDYLGMNCKSNPGCIVQYSSLDCKTKINCYKKAKVLRVNALWR